jgi:hypothetical protein
MMQLCNTYNPDLRYSLFWDVTLRKLVVTTLREKLSVPSSRVKHTRLNSTAIPLLLYTVSLHKWGIYHTRERGLPRFPASTAMLIRSAIFWDVTQRRVVITARTFPYITYVTACWVSFLLGLSTLEDGMDTLSRNVGKQLPNEEA